LRCRVKTRYFRLISPAAEKIAHAATQLPMGFLSALTSAKVKRGPGPRDWKPDGPAPNLKATAAIPSRRLVGLFRQ
jgi:hypothetical protein